METSLLICSSNTQLTAIKKDFSLNDLILKMIPDLEDEILERIEDSVDGVVDMEENHVFIDVEYLINNDLTDMNSTIINNYIHCMEHEKVSFRTRMMDVLLKKLQTSFCRRDFSVDDDSLRFEMMYYLGELMEHYTTELREVLKWVGFINPDEYNTYNIDQLFKMYLVCSESPTLDILTTRNVWRGTLDIAEQTLYNENIESIDIEKQLTKFQVAWRRHSLMNFVCGF